MVFTVADPLELLDLNSWLIKLIIRLLECKCNIKKYFFVLKINLFKFYFKRFGILRGRLKPLEKHLLTFQYLKFNHNLQKYNPNFKFTYL